MPLGAVVFILGCDRIPARVDCSALSVGNRPLPHILHGGVWSELWRGARQGLWCGDGAFPAGLRFSLLVDLASARPIAATAVELSLPATPGLVRLRRDRRNTDSYGRPGTAPPRIKYSRLLSGASPASASLARFEVSEASFFLLTLLSSSR